MEYCFTKRNFSKNIVRLLRKHDCYGINRARVKRGGVSSVVHGNGTEMWGAFPARALGNTPPSEEDKGTPSVQSGVWHKLRPGPCGAPGCLLSHNPPHTTWPSRPIAPIAGLGMFGQCSRACGCEVRTCCSPCVADPLLFLGSLPDPAHSGPPFRLHCGRRGRSRRADVLFTVLASHPNSSLPAPIFLVYYFSNCTIPRHSS